jgi:DNA-directed RNA polymerase specialized sigma24 family protein
MSRTYEERVDQELDALYQGALFLTAGSEEDAQWLLLDTVAGAYRETESGGADSAQWFEGHLARRFLGSTAAPAAAPTEPADIAPIPALGPDDLFRAAAAVPSWARAALWLVLLREWSYRDATTALGVSIETLRRMLDYRHVLVREMLRSDRPLRGAEGSVT